MPSRSALFINAIDDMSPAVLRESLKRAFSLKEADIAEPESATSECGGFCTDFQCDSCQFLDEFGMIYG